MSRYTPPRIEVDTVSGHVVVTKADGTTEIDLTGAPGGSDNEGQYNNGGSFGGMAGLTYNEGTNRPDMPNGWRVTVSGNTATFGITPNGARTITFQDATQTVVARDTTDTLTNKTIVAASNTITDTSAASGDLLVHNGTRFVRLAKGANGTFLGVTGGVVGYYSTGAGGSPGGSNTQIQYNNAGSFGGASITTTGAQLTFGSSGYIEMNTTPATGGYFRCGTAAADILTVRNAANSANLPVASHDGSNKLFLGQNAAGSVLWSNIDIFSSATTRIGGSSIGLVMDSAKVGIALPLLGSSSPYGADGFVDVSSAAPHTLSAAEYAMKVIAITGTGSAGGTMTFPNPADDAHAYYKWIYGVGLTSGVTISVGAGTTATLSGLTSPTYTGLFLFRHDSVKRVIP